jgi:ribosomal protein S18 acetylase RimI-like enzyme
MTTMTGVCAGKRVASQVRMRHSQPMTAAIMPLRETDIPLLVAAFTSLGWPGKDTEQYLRYLDEQERDIRPVRVAWVDGKFAGYVTVRWQGHYEPFRAAGIPEIQDLNVMPEFRRRGIATAMMDEAEALIGTRSRIVGLGVGLYADYGPAQAMYARRGYVPDARGVVYAYEPIEPGSQVRLDDDLNLMMTLNLDK